MDTETKSVCVEISVSVPAGSDHELAAEIVKAALAADERIYLVYEHTTTLLLER